ncbi:MAG TPA: helicase-related protein, partial [Gemmataceae bacterium]|nr:helicase-related protein [Gemmataceae bacterium]
VGWSRHVEGAREVIAGTLTPAKLGPAPADLAETLASLAIAGPGIVALRALGRIAPARHGEKTGALRDAAGSLAHAFLHLFNLPEVMALVRDRQKVLPYWRSVLDYCAAGNLQAVMDEYAHVLVESLGLLGKTRDVIAADVSQEIQRSLTLRTATAQADLISAGKRRVRMEETIRLRTRFAMRFGDQETEESAEPTRADQVRSAFNSPFWPFVLATTSVGQEGLDFHTYCHAVVHWNLPSNPVDLEQREGRVHRYKGHALRRNIAAAFTAAAGSGGIDPWAAMFEAAQRSKAPGQNDLFPFWVVPSGPARIERHVPAHPYSREVLRHENLRRSLVLYRMVFGQNRQEDLVSYLAARLPAEAIPPLLDLCRVDLTPPQETTEPTG